MNVKDKDYTEFKLITDNFFNSLKDLSADQKSAFVNNFAESVDTSATPRELVRTFLEDYLLKEGQGSDMSSTIEHIIPEKDLSDWQNISDTNKTLANNRKIGNLTLLSTELNNDAGHKNFSSKYIDAYYISRYTVNNNLNEWSNQFNSDDPIEQAVLPRGKVIAESIFDLYLENLSS